MSVGQAPRGAILKVDGEDVARVWTRSTGWMRWSGWEWSARSDKLGIPWKNTAAEGRSFETIEEAKATCEAYVRESLGL